MRLPSVLELRLARHNNAAMRLKTKSRIVEPPAIEGYLVRIKPKTQTRTTIYVATHDGNLFVCSTNKAHAPPPPPTPTPSSSPNTPNFPPPSPSKAPSPAKNSAKSTKGVQPPPTTLDEFKQAERQRSTLQILGSSGLVDLRSIEHVRRLGRTPRPSGSTGEPETGSSEPEGSVGGGGPAAEDWESLDEDLLDEGGEAGLKAGKTAPVSELRRKRMFEIKLTNGEVQTFEVGLPPSSARWVHGD